MQLRSWLSIGVCLIGAACAFLGATVLFFDATTFDLAAPDPVAGRIKACYTLLDDLFRTTAPLDWARPVEVGGALLAALFASRCGRHVVRSLRHSTATVAS